MPAPQAVVPQRRARGRRPRATVLVSKAKDTVLQKHYEPRGTQGSFVSAVLAADPKIRPKAAQDYWRLRRLQARAVVPKRGRKQQKKQRLAGLDVEQRAALEDLFMRQFRMSIGVRALWEAFNETNEKQQQALVEEQEILRRERELEATVRKPADAEKYRVEQVAQAERMKLELEAAGRAKAEREMGTARADVTKATGTADAQAIRAKGLAEAEVVKETGLAEAQAMAEKAESWKQYNDAALAQMMVDVLPRLAEAIAAPLAKTDRITVVGGGEGGTGLSGITGDVVRMMAQIPPVAESLTGVKIGDVISRVTGGETKNDNPAQE